MTKVEVSKCCNAIAYEDYKTNKKGEDIDIWVCDKCKKECEVELECETCLGTGTVDQMGYVYPGEPHMAPIDTGRCPDCSCDDYDDDNRDDQ